MKNVETEQIFLPGLLCMERAPDPNPWPLSKSLKILCIVSSSSRAWLCTWLLGVCTWNFSKHHVALNLSFEQKTILNNFNWNYDKEAYNKVKIKNFLSKSPLKVKFLFIMFAHFSQWTQCSIISYSVWDTFHTNVDWLPRRLHHPGHAPVFHFPFCWKEGNSWCGFKGEMLRSRGRP